MVKVAVEKKPHVRKACRVRAIDYYSIEICDLTEHQRDHVGFEIVSFGHLLNCSEGSSRETLKGSGVVYMPDRTCLIYRQGRITIVGRTLTMLKKAVDFYNLDWPGDDEVCHTWHHPAHRIN